jgi:hypothetical protein
MKMVRLISLALTLGAASSFAGEIYGTIKEGQKPVGKGMVLQIRSGAMGYTAFTDDFGNYRVIIEETGKCEIMIQFKGQLIYGEIQSYWSAARFDWVIENEGGHYTLRRQ